MFKKICLVKSNFNREITDKMLNNAVKILKQRKIKYEIHEVFGAFEIPYTIKKLAKKNKFDAYIAIGCLIKGETYHFEYISQAVSYGLMKLSIELTKPIYYSILNCQNIKQAQKRINNIKNLLNKIL